MKYAGKGSRAMAMHFKGTLRHKDPVQEDHFRNPRPLTLSDSGCLVLRLRIQVLGRILWFRQKKTGQDAIEARS